MTKTYFIIFNCLMLLILNSNETKAQTPLFPNSVVSNDIDFILDTDPDAFVSLAFIGLQDKEMPSSLSSMLFDEDTFVFEATFSNGTKIGIWCHSSFLTQTAAQEYADKLCPRLGKLPNIQRDELDHVVIHNGDATAFAETQGNFFVLYSDNMDARISTHDLEETVFHESVHATIQGVYGNAIVWTSAQSADPAFVTDYAQSLPALEDMSESALFAYTFLIHPGRLSSDIEDWLIQNNPNRLEFFRMIYLPTTSVSTSVDEFDITTHPNPTNGKFILILEEVEKNSQINIFTVAGELVKSIKATQGQNEIDLGELSNGVYLLSAPGYKVSKIIKQ